MVKSVLQEISGLRTCCVDPQLAQSIRYIILFEEEFRWYLIEYVLSVLTQLKVVVCFRRSLQMLHFYTAESGGLFQVFLADDDFYTAESGGLFQVFLTDDAFLHCRKWWFASGVPYR